MRRFGSVNFFVRKFLHIIRYLMSFKNITLLRFSISFCVSFIQLNFSRNLSISSKLLNLLTSSYSQYSFFKNICRFFSDNLLSFLDCFFSPSLFLVSFLLLGVYQYFLVALSRCNLHSINITHF